MRVLPLGCLGLEEVAERRAVLRRGLLPVALDGVPAVAQALLIGVAILRDDRSDSLRVARRETEAHGCALVEDVDGIRGHPSHCREPLDDLGEVFEGVPERRPVWRLG